MILNNSYLIWIKLVLIACSIIFKLPFIRCDDLNYFTRSDVSEGLIFPRTINVKSGENIFIRLNSVQNQTNCLLRTSFNGEVVDVTTLTGKLVLVYALKTSTGTTPDEFPNHWSPDIQLSMKYSPISSWPLYSCGIQITNITISDNGYWRLTSRSDTNSIRGVTLIEVSDPVVNEPITIESPFAELTPRDTTYCYVLRPDDKKIDFPTRDVCQIPPVDELLDANGLWNVIAGVAGQTAEIIYSVNVAAKAEELFMDVTTNQNQIILRCNLLNSPKNITYCHFIRLIDDVGFNIEEGIGISKYSYYGAGFKRAECGMIIQNPTDVDFSRWKCFIGLDNDGTLSTMGGLLDASVESPENYEADGDDVFAINETTLDILCENRVAIDYCWFNHPNGTRFSVSDQKEISEEDTYRYYGAGLKLGQCGITITKANLSDSGVWKCNMGIISISSLEVSKDINVRVSDSRLVAASLYQEVLIGSPLIIECTAIPQHVAIDYCRFVMPNGVGFSIHENVTSENQIFNYIHFNPNRQRINGFCSIVLRESSMQDNGLWTCAAKLNGRLEEHWDDFTIRIIENSLSVAAIIGMSFGSIIVFVIIVFVVFRMYRKRKLQRVRSNEQIEMDVIENS